MRCMRESTAEINERDQIEGAAPCQHSGELERDSADLARLLNNLVPGGYEDCDDALHRPSRIHSPAACLKLDWKPVRSEAVFSR